jgi:hypothetical protein
MPKVNVIDSTTDGFRVEVTWASHSDISGHVQVATTNEKSPFTFDPSSDPGSIGEPFNGWFVTLDRDGCNRAIRALRKARDAAFGPDA